jgi:hypothetical protein
MKLAYNRVLLGAASGLVPPSVLTQIQTCAAETFRMMSVAGIPIDWTHEHVVFSEGNSR